MSNSSRQPSRVSDAALTPGFLPMAAFRHAEPTAIGVINLDQAVQSMMTGLGPEHRDALLLARLHGQPLGVVHVPDRRALTSAEELARLAGQQLEARVRNHQDRFGCEVNHPCCRSSAPPELPGAVAVIIATVGRTDTLDRCLRSLAPHLDDNAEIIVIDNQPALATRQLLSQWSAQDARVRYVAEPRRGLSNARNRGVAETRCEFVAFTDDDAIVDQRWLQWLLAPFADPKVTVATGLVLPLELETVAQKRFEQYAGFCKGFERRCYDLQGNRADERLLYPFWGGVFGSGNSMAFRREELVAAGGFDPALGAGSIGQSGEDIDAMSKAILRGGQLVYEPRSLCWHEHRRDEDALRRQLFSYGVGLTAMLTKASTHDFRFAGAALRAVSVARQRHRSACQSTAAAALPPELARIERKGMLRGPVRYARAVRWAQRMRLGEVIAGG